MLDSPGTPEYPATAEKVRALCWSDSFRAILHAGTGFSTAITLLPNPYHLRIPDQVRPILDLARRAETVAHAHFPAKIDFSSRNGPPYWSRNGTEKITATTYSSTSWNTKEFFDRAKMSDIHRCLQLGADVNARDEKGWTPLHKAASFSKTPGVVLALLEAGADPNEENEKGWAVLHRVAMNSNIPEAVAALVQAGSDPNARTGEGLTPLHCAASSSAILEIATALIDAGARSNIRDTRG